MGGMSAASAGDDRSARGRAGMRFGSRVAADEHDDGCPAEPDRNSRGDNAGHD
jgi:hypothetical protein